jgi:hypothetical protein
MRCWNGEGFAQARNACTGCIVPKVDDAAAVTETARSSADGFTLVRPTSATLSKI